MFWQRSRFVDKPEYRHMSPEWKREREKEESRIIRGPGAVGTPECNAVFKVEGPNVTEEMMNLIALAPIMWNLLLKIEPVLLAHQKWIRPAFPGLLAELKVIKTLMEKR